MKSLLGQKLILIACLLPLLVSGCASDGVGSKNCAGRNVVRLSNAVIDKMTDEEVRAELERNETSASLGCAKPN